METSATLRQALLTRRKHALTRIYQQGFPVVRRYVLQHGGSTQDAKDVFQDAMVVFYEKATQESFVLSAAVSTYLLGIGKNLWQRELSRRGRLPFTVLTEEHAERPAAAEPGLAEEVPVLDFVARLGERCKNMLLAFYYFQQPLEQIADSLHYGSIRSATVQKFKCLERLRKSVRAAVSTAVAD